MFQSKINKNDRSKLHVDRIGLNSDNALTMYYWISHNFHGG